MEGMESNKLIGKGDDGYWGREERGNEYKKCYIGKWGWGYRG